MVEAFLLDSLLVIIIVLLGLMGLWRGPVRELLASVGIFAGMQLAGAWALDIGDRISGSIDMRLSSASFLSALVVLAIVTLLVGYGGALLIVDRDLVLKSRIAGLAVGLANGLLVVAFSVQLYQRFLLPDQQSDLIDDTRLAEFLSEDFRFAMLAYVLVAGLVVLFGRVAAAKGLDEARFPAAWQTPAPVPQTRRELPERSRAVPVPRSADEGKIEPAADGSNRAASKVVEETREYTASAGSALLAGGVTTPTESPWATNIDSAPEREDDVVDAFTLWSLGFGEPLPRQENDERRDSESVVSGASPSNPGGGSEAEERSSGAQAPADVSEQPDLRMSVSAAESRPPIELTCNSCGWELAADDRFCPNCGHGTDGGDGED